jgi:thiopurine S-methyltransferase
MEGPPFSISKEEINQHYSDSYNLTLVLNSDVSGGLKGKYVAKENIWLLNCNSSPI